MQWNILKGAAETEDSCPPLRIHRIPFQLWIATDHSSVQTIPFEERYVHNVREFHSPACDLCIHRVAASSATRSFIAFRKARTCFRFTVGNPSRKSSIDDPPSRYSISVCTGTRVPANTGVPLMI